MKVVGKPKLIFSLIINGITILWGTALLTNSPYHIMRLIGLFIIILAIIFIFPALLFPDSIWSVDKTSLNYNSFNSYTNNVISFYNYYLLKKGIKYQIKINLDMIKHIKVTYKVHHAFFLLGCFYDVCFDITTKDNSRFNFRVLQVGKKRKDFNEAVSLLKQHHITFIDEYNILEHLQNSPQNISYYLEQLEKKKEGKQ